MTIEINNQDGYILLDNIVATQSISANILIANTIQNTNGNPQVNFPVTPTVSGSFFVYHTGNLTPVTPSITSGLGLRVTDVETVNTLQSTQIQALSAANANGITSAAVASLTGSLQTQITANTTVDNAQQATLSQLTSVSGSFATLPTVASLTGSLQTQITAINVLDAAQQITLVQLTSVSGSFATITTVAAVSAGLNSRLTDVELNNIVQSNNIASLSASSITTAAVRSLTGALALRVTDLETVNTLQSSSIASLSASVGGIAVPSLSAYATTAAVASLTGSLQTQITANGVVDTAQQATLSQLTSITASLPTSTLIASLTGNLQTQITAINVVDAAQQTTLSQIAGITGNFVDRTSVQTVGGFKTFTGAVNISGNLNVGTGVIVYTPVTSANWSPQPTGLLDAVDKLALNKFKLTGSTSNNTSTEIFVNGTSSNRIVVPTDTTYAFVIYVSARRTDSGSESAGYKFEGVLRNVAGTVTMVNSAKTVLAEDQNNWDSAVSADNTNKSLNVNVTGQNSKTISWAAYVNVFPV
jgi:hypothetical protein